MKPGTRVVVLIADNLPCAVGDAGTVHAVRHAARDFPIGVVLDGGQCVEWFRESELKEQA